MVKFFNNSRGSAMPTAISVVAILTMLGVGTVRLVLNHSKSTPGRDELQEVEMLRATILNVLDCRRTVGVGGGDALVSCTGQSLILKDASGTPIFTPVGTEMLIESANPAGEVQPIWTLRAVCRDGQIAVERKMAKTSSNSIFANYAGLWPSGQEPRLCESYFRVPPLCSGQYDVNAGFDEDGATCCRMVENSGTGSAAAICRDTEYLIAGGGYCAGSGAKNAATAAGETKTVERCMLNANALAIGHIGSGSARGITLTQPSLLMVHTDTALPAIMEARATFQKSKSMLKDKPHGGFLIQNGQTYSASSLTVDGWVSSCKYDDWEGPFATTARAYCCPKKRQ
jgi:hypothetical protein